MNYSENILATIGNTPLVKINKITKDVDALVLAKLETFNPGNSAKDRMAVKMIDDAEKAGLLKPGGTIIEGTSGNTGMGLALVAIIRGYHLICVISDKQSKEKMDILKAVGAEVVVCPTDVEPSDPKSYYSVSKRLAEETPNSWYVNQYDNRSNSIAHYESTGPEIWEQTDGKITHFVVGVGTGGTISGIGKYLKEQNKNVKVWGVDTYGSVFTKYHKTGDFDENEIYSYVTEGIGEDILPKNVDFSVIDGFTKVTDKDAAIFTRKLAKEEGIFVGNSAGAAIKGLLQLKHHFKKDDVVVVLFHDHGSRYVGKMFNDDWMKKMGYLPKNNQTVFDIIKEKIESPLIIARVGELVSHAVLRMREKQISQLPVIDKNGLVGSISKNELSSLYLKDKNSGNLFIKEVMNNPFPIVEKTTSIEDLKPLFENHQAVLVKLEDKKYQIITKTDLVNAIQ
ncbi:MAG: pyridoxal-phosphate dependent enzyme [Lutibacter sp.]